MTEIVLFVAPGSCARVPTIALEEIGVAFETRVVRFMAGEHKGDAYRRHNPKGKVPTLLVDGEALTENVAIIEYLNARFPEAALMPATSGLVDRARQTADLCFCAATLHPIVTRIRLPTMFAAAEAASAVYERAALAMREYFDLIEKRLADSAWWYGGVWSAMDAYIFWIFWRVEGAGFDVSPFPNFTRHARTIESRPSVQRALAREAVAAAQLQAEGLAFTPPPITLPHPKEPVAGATAS